MSTVRKFTFDRDFGAPEEPEVPEIEEEEEPEVIVPTFSEEEMAAARAEGVLEGLEQGRKEAADATEQKLLETIEQACEKIAEIYSAQAEANREIATEMISVSTAISKKMFPDLNARNALGEVERVVQETLKAITEEPRVQIIVNPDLRELLTERLATMTHRAGFDGKVFVNGDPSLILGDCRIEWSNGAAIRNSEELWEMIDEIIERNLHGTPDDDDDEDAVEGDDSVAEASPTPPETPVIDEAPQPEPEPAPEPIREPEADYQPEPDFEPEADVQAEPDLEPDPETQIHSDDVLDTGVGAPTDPIPETESIQPNPEAFTEQAAEMPESDPVAEKNDTVDAPIGEPEDPTFTPSIPVADTLPEPDNSVLDQPINSTQTEPPIPSIEEEPAPAPDAEAVDAETEETEEPVRDFDPVSPATTAAILEAQSDMNDDDDPNPTDG